MNHRIEANCQLFIENRDRIKGEFTWENAYMYPLCAALYTAKGRRVNEEKLRDAMDLLKERAGLFSNFRSTVKLAIASMLDFSGNPEKTLNEGLKVYDMLKESFFSSAFLPIAAMIIAQMAEPFRYEEIAQRTRRIYDRMKSNHFFLTSSEDSGFAAMLALSVKGDDVLIEDMEACYDILSSMSMSSNAVQSLSHVLSISEATAESKCRRTVELYGALKEAGCRYGKGYELPTLGVLALSEGDISSITETMVEIDDFLSAQKGFGVFGIGAKQRLMYAGILAQSEYLDKDVMSAATVSSTVSIIVAQQAAMCAAVAASAAAASASASS